MRDDTRATRDLPIGPPRCYPSVVIPLLLFLTVVGCADSIFVEAPDTISTSVRNDSLAADGASATEVVAELPQTLSSSGEVLFTTDLGRFRTATGGLEQSVVVRATDHVATARLVSPLESGRATITVRNPGATGRADVEFVPASPDSIDLFVDRVVSPADGATAITATAVLRRAIGVVSPGTVVRFEVRSAQSGAVEGLGGSVVADATGAASIKIVSDTAFEGEIRAVAGGVVSSPRSVRFVQPS